ncbi:hypothetical protein [Streptomyces sp. NPDC096033]|uniref:hypothetical protein n=1 Tax=Streptomyces sp. NPDC096033 TaxID=3366071 RepID=UPI00381B0317
MASTKILISPTGYAHLPGQCVHHVEDPDTANWGWINDADLRYWDRIQENNPAAATSGNLDLAATRRCRHCDTKLHQA